MSRRRIQLSGNSRKKQNPVPNKRHKLSHCRIDNLKCYKKPVEKQAKSLTHLSRTHQPPYDNIYINPAILGPRPPHGQYHAQNDAKKRIISITDTWLWIKWVWPKSKTPSSIKINSQPPPSNRRRLLSPLVIQENLNEPRKIVYTGTFTVLNLCAQTSMGHCPHR